MKQQRTFSIKPSVESDPGEGPSTAQSGRTLVSMGGALGIYRQVPFEGGSALCLERRRDTFTKKLDPFLQLFNHKMSSPPNEVPWPNNEKDYHLIEIIGVGATAVVYSAFCAPRNEKCAIKRINLENWNTPIEELLKEIQAMSFCNHENVVTYYTSFVVREELWLILKLLEGGSLLDVIKHKMKVTNCKNGVFDEATIATLLKEVLKGLEYFHSNGQIHRDIKAGNILLGEDGIVQIADFGVSSWLSTGRDTSRQKVRYTFVGTPCWMAPEVMDQENGYDFKADIWSFGITAIEMATGTAPYHKFPPMKVLMLTMQNDPPSLDTSAGDKDTYKLYGKSFRKMITECLQKDPAKRSTASELLKHPFFRKAKDRKYITQTLVAIGPSMETRVYKASKRHTSNSHMHRSNTGEWVWSDDERGSLSSQKSPRPHIRAEPAIVKELQVPKKIEAVKEGSHQDYARKNVLSLVLRVRNGRRELNDIRFNFVTGRDTVDGIASELVAAGLVLPTDAVEVALNLSKLMDAQNRNLESPRTVTFHLNSARSNEPLNDKALLGFAQLTLIN